MKHLIFTITTLICFFFETSAQRSIPTGAPSDYEVKNLKALNSDQLDYSAIPFRSGVMFTSTRKRSKLFGCDADFTEGHYSDLYYAEKDAAGNFHRPVFVDGDVNGIYHDGTATFAEGQTRMYYSRNNSKGVNSHGSIDLKIYEAVIHKNHWSNVGELPFSSDEFKTCHPTISPNGKWLYFSSDRPGGYGGMDIYVAEKMPDGRWATPINLGPKVNSDGNELFPFIAADGTLYWASDGFGGMGGLDIFAVPMKKNGAKRYHLPSPLNSYADDFAFSTNYDGTEGYMTSNRKGGVGKDDLFSWKFTGVKTMMANICVIDRDSRDRIGDAYLEIVPLGEKKTDSGLIEKDGVTYLQMEATEIGGKEYLILVPYDKQEEAKADKKITGKSCGMQVAVVPGGRYQLTVDKPGYQPLRKTVTGDDLLEFEEYLIPIGPQPPVAIRGQVKDKNSGSSIPFADVRVINECTGRPTEIIADRNGQFSFAMQCDCDYEIKAMKGDYKDEYELVYSEDIRCNKDNATVLLYLEKANMTYKPNPKKSPGFKKGAVIRLDKLYYDYNKHFIRSDAAIELDKIVAYMRQYPSLEIELGSHTDARGSDEYNRELSQRRAEAAVDYIVSRGISRKRIVARGYGESVITNRCRDGVHCNDYEHEQNRRTEVTVTNFDEENVQIER